MKFLQLSSIAFVSFSLTFFNDIQTLLSLNFLSENPKSLIHLSPVLAQSSTDKKAEAERLLKQGIQQAQSSQYQEAIQSWEQSLKLYQEIGDRKGEAISFSNLGEAYRRLGQYQKSIDFHQQALLIEQQIKDHDAEASSLNNLGSVYYSFGQYKKAIEFYQKSLVISHELGNSNREANALNNLGIVYLSLGQYQRSIEFFEQSLVIRQKIGDYNGVANSLGSLGNLYFELGQYQKAIEFFQKCLAIKKQLNDHDGIAKSLGNLGNNYRSLGLYEKAIDFYQESLLIFQKIGERQGEANSMMNLGITYRNLGLYQEAIEFLQQSLSIFHEISDKNGEANSRNNLGNTYQALKQHQKAIEFLQQSLFIYQQIGDRNGEARSLNNLGNAYRNLGEYQKAIEFYQQSLSIQQEIGDRNGEANSLANLGNAYDSLGEYQKAIEFSQQSLSIFQEIGDRAGERQSLSNIGLTLSKQNQPELAIVFYKQSVNVTESIRQDIRGLDRDLQQSYLETVADSYRSLADLLLQQDRILEAQQVIDLLKVQELEDYLKNVRGNTQTQQGLELLPAERQLWTQYNALQEKAISINQEFTQLDAIDAKNRTPAQQQRIGELVNQEKEMRAIFNDFLASPPIQKLVQTLSRITEQENINLRSYSILQKSLANLQQNAVILYPLILENRLELILVNSQTAAPIRRVVNVKRDVLNQAILDYRTGLKQDLNDPETFQKTAQTLYDYLIKPLEKDLADLKTETLIYAPDGQLRYVPLAGLYDGQQWLIQKYRINNITASSLTDFALKPRNQPLVLAGAFSDQQTAYKFKIGDREFDFNGLEFADDEINNIVATLPNTKAMLNRDFNRNQTEVNMGDYNILHFATHGAFVVGQPEDSFVLFGDGDRASLRDMGTWDLGQVDLVVFSACQTALGNILSANGEEILGLGYTIQRQGARATVATLWTIDDASTQQLMNIFYQELQQGKSISEALRQAQIALITGKVSHPNSEKNINQPYYWAAFIIIGNGF